MQQLRALTGFSGHQRWCFNLALLITGCLTLGKLFRFQFSQLYRKDYNGMYLIESLRRIKLGISWAWYLAHTNHLMLSTIRSSK